MKQLLIDIQNRLIERVPELKYVDEDWGQLDYYNVAQPVKYPLAVININMAAYTNEGAFVQQGLINIVVTVCDIKLSNTSGAAPQLQKQAAWKVFDIMDGVVKALHGWAGSPNYSKLSRIQINRRKNDEGLNLFDLIFTTNLQDTIAMPRVAHVSGAVPKIKTAVL